MEIAHTHPAPSAGPSNRHVAPIDVFRHDNSGTIVMARQNDDRPTGDDVVDAAYEHAARTLRYLDETVGWQGIDGAGTGVSLIANDPGYTHWDHATRTVRLSFDGDGDRRARPTALAADVVAHEIGHGVALSRNPAIEGNSALGQALANTLAMAIDTDDWKLGEDVWSPERLHDYQNPLRKFSDPHGTAMARIGDAIGRDDMFRAFFHATPSFRPDDTVAETAMKVADAARRIELGPTAIDAIERAWDSEEAMTRRRFTRTRGPASTVLQ